MLIFGIVGGFGRGFGQGNGGADFGQPCSHAFGHVGYCGQEWRLDRLCKFDRRIIDGVFNCGEGFVGLWQVKHGFHKGFGRGFGHVFIRGVFIRGGFCDSGFENRRCNNNGGNRVSHAGRWHLIGLGAQNNAVILHFRLDPALNFTFGDAVQHGSIRRGRFGTKVAVLGCQIAEVFGNGFHRVERVIKPFQRAREGAIGHR